MEPAILEFQDVSQSAGERRWLDRLNLTIGRGECLGIIAPQESIQCIFSLLQGQPGQSGCLIVDGKRMGKSMTINAAIQHGIGILCPPMYLFPNMTVKDNLTFGLTSPIIRRRRENHFVRQHLEELELSFDLDVKLSAISQEEQMLVGIAKTLIRSPRIVLVDQLLPMTPLTLNKLQQIILRQQRAGVSFLFFSSRFDDILGNIVRHVATITDGRISPFRDMEDVRQRPELLVQLLAGTPATSFPLEERENQISAYQVLQDVNALIASEYDMSFVLHFLAERISEMFDAYACRIIRINAKSGETEIISYGEQKLPQSELIDEAVYRMQYDDTASYLDAYWRTTLQYIEPDALPIEAVCISLPSALHTRVVGVVQLFFERPKLMDEKAFTILNSFSQQVALVIENVSLSTQSTLLKEAHHRIKNNLQSVTALLNLQINLSANTETREALDTTIMRIKAIAAVHELLSGSSNASGMVDLKDIFLILLRNYEMQAAAMEIEISTHLINYLLSFSKTTSLALILNEIITNCFKHAFPADAILPRAKTIRLNMVETKYQLVIEVVDNGVGLAQPGTPLAQETERMGMRLIHSLSAHDLAAEYTIRNNLDFGTTSTLTLDK